MRKALSVIVLALGLLFATVPVAGATATTGVVPCSTSPDAGPGTNNTPCAPECVPSVDALNARLTAAWQTVADRNITITALVAWQNRAIARIDHKNARIERLERKLAEARSNG